MTEEERTAGKRLPLMRQAQVGLRAMPKATRVAEFVALWTITKAKHGETSVEDLAEFWGQPVRTLYRRLDEFREVWAPVGYDTPDKLADHVIANYRRRKEELEARKLAKLMSAEIPAPPASVLAVAAA